MDTLEDIRRERRLLSDGGLCRQRPDFRPLLVEKILLICPMRGFDAEDEASTLVRRAGLKCSKVELAMEFNNHSLGLGLGFLGCGSRTTRGGGGSTKGFSRIGTTIGFA